MKKTVRRRKYFLPQASERAPISGALRNDKKPCDRRKTINMSASTFPKLTLKQYKKRIKLKIDLKLNTEAVDN